MKTKAKLVKLTRQERADDEDLIARVIAFQALSGRAIQRHSFGTERTYGSACAVGASVLYNGLDLTGVLSASETTSSAIEVFAKHYAVPEAFAVAVSDGFEKPKRGQGHASGHVLSKKEKTSRAYARGWAVGAACASAFDVDD